MATLIVVFIIVLSMFMISVYANYKNIEEDQKPKELQLRTQKAEAQLEKIKSKYREEIHKKVRSVEIEEKIIGECVHVNIKGIGKLTFYISWNYQYNIIPIWEKNIFIIIKGRIVKVEENNSNDPDLEKAYLSFIYKSSRDFIKQHNENIRQQETDAEVKEYVDEYAIIQDKIMKLKGVKELDKDMKETFNKTNQILEEWKKIEQARKRVLELSGKI